jgi:uncharacterized Tic20 family protein
MAQNASDGAGQTPADQTPPPPPPAEPQPDAGDQQPTGVEAVPAAKPAREECTMAMLCHLLVIFTGFIAPLIIWLVKRDESRFVDQQGKEALNWAITLLIASVCIFVIAWIPILGWVIGCLGWLGIVTCNIVFGILSTIKVNAGESYRYPVCIRLIK